MTTGKAIALARWIFVGKLMSLLFNMLSRLVISFLPRRKHIFNFMAAVPKQSDFGAPKNSLSRVHCFSFKPTFSLSSFTFIKRFFSSSLLSAIRVLPSTYLRLLIFLPAILIPACASFSPEFLLMHSVYKLNKRVTIYSLDVLLVLFGTSLLFQVGF